MKYLVIFLLTVLSVDPITAQDETLFNDEIESGGYGGPICKIGQINGSTGIFFGGQGGWIINHSLALGGKGYVLASPMDIKNLQNISVGFACGGVLLEYIIASSKLLHFNIECMIGAGGVYNDVINYAQYHNPIEYTGDAGLLLEPGFNLNLNITRYLRIAAGLTYRYMNGIEYDAGAPYTNTIGNDYENISDSDLSGVSAQLVIKFGKF
jgi:hypothetical protein